MNTLRTIGYAICVTLVVTSIFLMLLPSGKMAKICLLYTSRCV